MVIARIFLTYRPFAVFSAAGCTAFALGFAIGLRFLYAYLNGQGAGHVQSVILSALLLGAGAFLFVTGMVADLISVNRKLLEKVDYRLRRLELEGIVAQAPSSRGAVRSQPTAVAANPSKSLRPH